MKLEGLKVLDLSAFLPGPHMTMMMADHGADIIMIEPANGTGEPARGIGQKTDDGVTVWFRNIARGKRSLKINLKDPDGLDLFLRLADTTDVVVEAFRPGVVKRLGIDYETLAARNPKIVYCSISAFGQNNSKSQKPAHDLTVQGMAGLADLNRGLKDDLPAMPNIPFADAAGSMMALSAVLMALLRRHATGQGDYIDVAMYDACLSWTPNVMGPVFGEGRHPDPKNMRSFGGSAMYNIYETADGAFLILGGSEIKFATNLLDALGRSDLLDYAKLEPGPGQAPLRDFFAKTFASKSLDEWKAFLEPIDCCWSWVRSLKEAFDDPFTVEREMVVTDADGNRHIGVPVKFLLEPGKLDHRIPEYGQHSEDIARGAGLESKTVKDMQDRGVI